MPLLFPNPPLTSLHTSFSSMAAVRGLALKFPRLVSPFAAVLDETASSFDDLHALLEPGEAAFVVLKAAPNHAGLSHTGPWGVTQMEWPGNSTPNLSTHSGLRIASLNCAHASEMVALTDIAFPGFFRPGTCQMGEYFGIRTNAGELIAMAGERMNIGIFHEVSGVCTHPNHVGKGYAKALVTHLLRLHRASGSHSYLHVSTSNTHALDIYTRMGFRKRGELLLYNITRASEDVRR